MSEGERASAVGAAERGWFPTRDGQMRYWDGRGWAGGPVPDPGPGPWPQGWYPHPGGPYLGEWDGQGWTRSMRQVPAAPAGRDDPPPVEVTRAAVRNAGNRSFANDPLSWVQEHAGSVGMGALGVAIVVAAVFMVNNTGTDGNRLAGERLGAETASLISTVGFEAPVNSPAWVFAVEDHCREGAELLAQFGDGKLAPEDVDVEAVIKACAGEAARITALSRN